MKSKVFLLFLTATLLVNLSSCVSLKKSIYLQGDIAQNINDIEGQFKVEREDYIVKPGDLLYIKVTSLDERSSAFLNLDAGFNQMVNNPMSASLLGYRVGLDGGIEYPFLGKIYVNGLTLNEIAKKVELAAKKYIEQSGAIVKLLNDNITVLGEVRTPGRFLMNSEEISILEAVALAGDMTDHANRRKIRLIRKYGDLPQMFIIDTTDERILYSQYFYLKPGDIIYVEPGRIKQWSLSSIPLNLFVGLTGAGLLIYNIVNNL
jgi:polysaccharide biosynthesis/export protein